MHNPTVILRLLLVGALALALAACGSRNIESDMGIEGAPDWVNEGTRAVNDNGGRLFHGVGSAPAMNDASLQKATADNRARAELASVLGTYMEVAIDDYTAARTDGENTFTEQAVSRQIDSATRVHLAGSRIIANWRNPDTGVIYSLGELDMRRIQDATDTVEDMDPGLRTHIQDQGHNIFDRFSGAQ